MNSRVNSGPDFSQRVVNILNTDKRSNAILSIGKNTVDTTNTGVMKAVKTSTTVRDAVMLSQAFKTAQSCRSNHITSHAIRKVDLSQRKGNVRYIGGSMIDMNRLMQNAPQASTSSPIKPSVKNKKVDTALMQEIDSLLGKRSSHADEAEDEWYQRYAQRMLKLSQHEYAADKAAKETQQIFISAFACKSCSNFLTELLPTLCKQQGHEIRKVRAVKRFFICNNCNKRDSILKEAEQDQHTKVHLPPNRRCVCGSNNWQACGQRGRAILQTNAKDMTSPASSLTQCKLVAAASEWTDRSDKVSMAVRVSALNDK